MTERRQFHIQGTVQGVGFRPFVYRLATTLELKGWVNNSPQGVNIELEGDPQMLDTFVSRLRQDAPALAMIQAVQEVKLPPLGYPHFEIRQSATDGHRTALILPDIATCADCLAEIVDPTNRRYRYPFTNCTHCGPRFSIIKSLPYDRPNTSMKHFKLCPICQAEYENPLDRRFHAQPNACPLCGPHLELWNAHGHILATHDAALRLAAEAIWQGQIVALKGLGGFQLLVDARDSIAVQRLRRLKHRPDKPLAVMFPSLESVLDCCDLSPVEKALLQQPAAPIVLARVSNREMLASEVAPHNPSVGVLLPYTPLHHLLLADLGFPIVATSGNRAGEPICIDEREALERLGTIADVWLVHNRPIVRHVDDSVVQVVDNQPMLLRRARGYAPMPIMADIQAGVIAVGAHQKNTVAVTTQGQVFLSQHIGDLDNRVTVAAFEQSIEDLQCLYEVEGSIVVHDLHPDYESSHYAQAIAADATSPTPTGRPRPRRLALQHHHAHLLAAMAEHQLEAPLLGVVWDGTGYGTDGTIWGGEFLRAERDGNFARVAHLRPFPLPGGEQAVKEPRRIALGLLYALMGEKAFEYHDLPTIQAFTTQERSILRRMLQEGINCPLTSSMGRLFDGVASLLGLAQRVSFEGQAAMALEFASTHETDATYSFVYRDGVLDWRPLLEAILYSQENVAQIGRTFHNTLIDMIVAVVVNEAQVVLTGGCFQNRLLLQGALQRLRRLDINPYWPQQVPPNDGGIALGQAVYVKKVQ